MFGRSSLARVALLALMASVSCARAGVGPGQSQQSGFELDQRRAKQDVITFGSFKIEQLELGGDGRGTSRTFRALATNTSDSIASLGVELRAIAGQWSPQGSLRGFAFDLAPGERRWIEATYTLGRFTPEAALRVSFGRPKTQAGRPPQIEDLFFRRWYALGAGNPAAIDLRAGMIEARTPHLLLLAAPGTPAGRALQAIGEQREAAVKTIADLLDAKFTGRIRMVFYPDSATKARATGHIGMGLAFNRNIVEIYSDSQRLDPYHELTHIIADARGNPPALFNEGLATYMTERLGADALEHLGHPGKKISAVACELARAKQLIPLDSILHYTDIGPDNTYGSISYPEAASFVQFLVESRGLEEFRNAYSRLVSSNDPVQWRANESVMRQLYGASIQELETRWLSSLHCASSRSS